MGIFSIFKKEKREIPRKLTYTNYSLYDALNDSNPTVIFCENLIANAISSLPIYLYKQKVNGRLKAVNHPSYRLTTRKPNLNEPVSVFYSTMIKHLLRHGNAYIYKLLDSNGEISQLILLNPVNVIIKMNGLLKSYEIDGKTYSNKEIIHIPSLYGYNGVKAKSVLDYAKESINNSNKMTSYISAYYDNNINSRIKVKIAKQDVSAEEIQEIGDFYSNAGSKLNSGKPLVEYDGNTVEGFNLPNNGIDEVSSSREYEERAICEFYNVPYALLKNQNGYGSFEEFNLFFKNNCLTQYTDRIEQYFAFGLLSEYEQEQYYFEFDYNELLRPDTKTRMDILDTQLKNGMLSVDEAREEVNRDSLEDTVAGSTHFMFGAPLRADVIEAWGAGAKIKAMQLEKQISNPESVSSGLEKEASAPAGDKDTKSR